jgi:hypothetical protein
VLRCQADAALSIVAAEACQLASRQPERARELFFVGIAPTMDRCHHMVNAHLWPLPAIRPMSAGICPCRHTMVQGLSCASTTDGPRRPQGQPPQKRDDEGALLCSHVSRLTVIQRQVTNASRRSHGWETISAPSEEW